MLHNDGCLITGAAGQCEIWTRDQDGRGDLGETCATAYELRVYDSLLRLRGDARYGDLMERTIYNTLFAAQSPDGRRLRYYSPVEGPRVYFEGDTYCCPCNYRRIVAELPQMVYYQKKNGLTVNLYTSSEARLKVGDDVPVTVRQETEYPHAGTVRLHVEPEKTVSFPLQLRIPGWAAGTRVTVNNQGLDAAVVPGTFLTIAREWRKGDQVAVEL